MKKNHLFLCFTIFTLLASCKPCENCNIDLDAVKAEIQSMEDAFAAASNARDAESVVKYYSDDAHTMPPNAPTLVGKAAILERMKKNVAEDEDGATERFEILDVFAAGNYATEVGKYIRTAKDGTEKTGKYVSIFEKRDGKYICIRDIYNDDAKYEDNDDDGDEMGEADDADVEEGS